MQASSQSDSAHGGPAAIQGNGNQVAQEHHHANSKRRQDLSKHQDPVSGSVLARCMVAAGWQQPMHHLRNAFSYQICGGCLSLVNGELYAVPSKLVTRECNMAWTHWQVGGVDSALGVGGGENSEDERHCQDGLEAPAGCLTYVENIGAATTSAPAVLVNLLSSNSTHHCLVKWFPLTHHCQHSLLRVQLVPVTTNSRKVFWPVLCI